jgi:hypothetical protein
MLTTRPSRREQLFSLHKAKVDELGALRLLGAWHAQAPTPELDFRDHDVRAGQRVFPAADTVPPLVAIAIAALREAFAECETRSDQTLVATYGAYLVTAIHPFADHNGHLALDFFQYLLQRRWGADAAVLNDRKDTHEAIGLAFAPIDDGPLGAAAGAPAARFEAMLQRLDRVTLAQLWTEPHLVAAAHFLARGCGLEFASRLPAHGA